MARNCTFGVPYEAWIQPMLMYRPKNMLSYTVLLSYFSIPFEDSLHPEHRWDIWMGSIQDIWGNLNQIFPNFWYIRQSSLKYFFHTFICWMQHSFNYMLISFLCKSEESETANRSPHTHVYFDRGYFGYTSGKNGDPPGKCFHTDPCLPCTAVILKGQWCGYLEDCRLKQPSQQANN